MTDRIFCHDEGVSGIGPMPCDVMIVGIAPGRDEFLKSKMPFTGPSGKLLQGLLKLIDLTREQVFLTNLYCQWNDSPSEEEILGCMPRFIEEVKAVKPKVILCLGKIVTETLMGDLIAPHNFGQAQGGAWYSDQLKAWMISTYHPAAYLYAGDATRAPVEIHDGVRDFRKIPLYLKAPPNFGHVDYRAVESLQEADAMLDHYGNTDMHDPWDTVAIDVETYYKESEQQGMKSIAFACKHGVYHIPEALIYGPHYEYLTEARCAWTFHNGMFDTRQINKWFGVDLQIVEDTMYMSYSLDERAGGDTESDATGMDRAVGIHGLKRLAREYCAAGFYDDTAHGRIDTLPPDELAYYNSCDAAYTYRLAEYFRPIQEADGVRQMYLELLVPAANVYREIHERGGYIDPKALKSLAKEWLPRWLETEDLLQAKAKEMGWTRESINTNSPKQLSEFIYDICLAPKLGKGKVERSTSRAILKTMCLEYPDHPAVEWVQLLLDWRGLDRDINVYIKGMQEQQDEHGFIHPEPSIHGTRNGRFSYHNPPINTIPKARTVGAERARIRRIFSAAPPSDRGTGPRVLLEADYRQAELWTASFVSGDENMMIDLTRCTKCGEVTTHVEGDLLGPDGNPLCSDGEPHESDFHARVAENNWGKTKSECEPVEWENLRDSAKITTYGIGYGAGPDALIGEKKLTGRGSTGVGDYKFLDTREQAQEAINNWLRRYNVYKKWREAEQRIVQGEGEQVSRTGRKRRYYMINNYHALNQAINMPCSSLAHDFLIASAIELHPLLKEYDAYILWDVHDALVFDLPKMYLKEVWQLIKRVMTKPRWGCPTGIPVDAKVGSNWYDVKSIEKVLQYA